jgi:hypothetical protein
VAVADQFEAGALDERAHARFRVHEGSKPAGLSHERSGRFTVCPTMSRGWR